MLDYQTLNRKPPIDRDINGENIQYIDLAAPTLNKNFVLNDVTAVSISEDYIARPDLVSFAVYGTDEYTDVICKVNGISNPFELGEGMVLLLPDIQTIKDMFLKGVSKTISSDDENINKLARSYQKAKNQRRNTAEQLVGERNYIIDKNKGLIIY